MNESNFSLVFPPMQNSSGRVKAMNLNTGAEFPIQVSLQDDQLLTRIGQRIPSHLADLLDLSVAVHTADRMIKKPFDDSRCFHITLPVRNPDLFGDPAFNKSLSKILSWFTNDQWEFKFIKRYSFGRNSELQSYLLKDEADAADTEVALWSGGLDSLSGLYHRLKGYPSRKFILIGTGSSNSVYKTQRVVAQKINKIFPGRTELVQFLYRAENAALPRNRYQRSRGFIFLLVGAICAYLKGQSNLYVYENGIGAINLPYTASEVGLDHTRSVNPISLIRMSGLLTDALDMPFSFKNPFQFYTKAEICSDLIYDIQAGVIPDSFISSTKSCDRLHRVPGRGVFQCGVCSSCILRRQALAAFQLPDPTIYLYNIDLTKMSGAHLKAMVYQVKKLRAIFDQPEPWTELVKTFIDLPNIVDHLAVEMNVDFATVTEQIAKMYRSYVEEWDICNRQGFPSKTIILPTKKGVTLLK